MVIPCCNERSRRILQEEKEENAMLLLRLAGCFLSLLFGERFDCRSSLNTSNIEGSSSHCTRGSRPTNRFHVGRQPRSLVWNQRLL